MAQPIQPNAPRPGQPSQPNQTEQQRREAATQEAAKAQAGREQLRPHDPNDPGRNPLQDPASLTPEQQKAMDKHFPPTSKAQGFGTQVPGDSDDTGDGGRAQRVMTQARTFAEIVVKETQPGNVQTMCLSEIRATADKAIASPAPK